MLWALIKVFKRSSTVALAIVSVIFAFVPEGVFAKVHLGLGNVVYYFDVICNNFSETEVCIVCNRILLVAIIWIIISIIILISILCRKSITIENKNYIIKVEYGDLLKCKKCKRVINFDECYTTELGQMPHQIKPTSICGQYLSSSSSLDIMNLLEQAEIEPADIKSQYDKKDRYESGTILPNGDDLLLAFAPLDNNGLGVFTSFQEYVNSLFLLWRELDKYYCQKDVCVPILGAGITRFGKGSGLILSQQELLDIMIWSYKISPYKLKKPYSLRIICQRQDGFSINEIDSK